MGYSSFSSFANAIPIEEASPMRNPPRPNGVVTDNIDFAISPSMYRQNPVAVP